MVAHSKSEMRRLVAQGALKPCPGCVDCRPCKYCDGGKRNLSPNEPWWCPMCHGTGVETE